MEIPKIITHYRKPRWQIETAFRDVKQHFGFDAYRLQSRKSINRFVQLSFIAAALTKLIFSTPEIQQKPISVQEVCQQIGIHWYRPEKLTQGLRVAYLRSQMAVSLFSDKFKQKNKLAEYSHGGSKQDDAAFGQGSVNFTISSKL